MRSTRSGVFMLLVGMLLIGATALGQDERKTLLKSMSLRLPTIQSLKQQDKIGETWKGDLATLKDTYLSEELVFEKKKITVRELIAAENADRKAMFTLIAKERSTETEQVTPEYVGEQNGEVFLKRRSKPGDWFLKKDGKWVQKQEPKPK